MRVTMELHIDDQPSLVEMMTIISKFKIVKLNAEALEHSVCSGENRETAPPQVDAGKQIRRA